MKKFASFNFIKPEGNNPIIWEMVSFTRYKKVYPRFSDADFEKIETAIKASGSQSRHKSKWYNQKLITLLNKPKSELDFIVDENLSLLNLGNDKSESKPRPFYISESTYKLLGELTNTYASQFKKPKTKVKQYLVMLPLDLIVH